MLAPDYGESRGVMTRHGQRDADGNIRATRVEKLSGSPEIELKGVVSNLGATSFELWGLTVAFSGAVIEPSGATVAEGDLVEVEGALSGSVLLVQEDTFKRTQIEMEGTVTATTATSVTLLGIEVSLTDLTEGTA